MDNVSEGKSNKLILTGSFAVLGWMQFIDCLLFVWKNEKKTLKYLRERYLYYIFAPAITTNESKEKHRGVEQLVARRAHNPKVVSSSLAPATSENSEFSEEKATKAVAFFRSEWNTRVDFLRVWQFFRKKMQSVLSVEFSCCAFKS